MREDRNSRYCSDKQDKKQYRVVLLFVFVDRKLFLQIHLTSLKTGLSPEAAGRSTIRYATYVVVKIIRNPESLPGLFIQNIKSDIGVWGIVLIADVRVVPP